MPKFYQGLSLLPVLIILAGTVYAETVVLNAVPGDGTGPLSWTQGGATFGDDASAPGGTASTYTGKVPNKRLYVPIADTVMSESDSIYSVQVRVSAKASLNMAGTYDGIRVAIRVGTIESRDRAIYELDTAYAYYSHIWGKNPVTGLNWTWAAVCSLQAGVFTAKKGQLTEATYYVDHVQVVVTYGNGNSPPTASAVSISGTPTVGQTLSGSYVYADKEADPEGISLYQWYRAESSNPNDTLKAAIKNSAVKNYMLLATEEAKYVSFEVTPVATKGILTGIPVESDMVGPVVGITGTMHVPGFARQNCVSRMTFVDMAGRSVTPAGHAQLSKGNYILISKSGLKTKYAKVAITK